MEKIFKILSIIFSLVLIFSGAYVASAAWSEPQYEAPTLNNNWYNSSEPINVNDILRPDGNNLWTNKLFTTSNGLNVGGILGVAGSAFIDNLGIGISSLSDLVGKLTVGGDIIINRPAVSPSTGYKLVLHSWSDTMSTDWSNINELNNTQWQSATDTCNNDKNAKFQCSASVNSDGQTCVDVYKEPVSGNIAYKKGTAVCSGSDSKYSLRTSGGILEFLNNGDVSKLTLNQNGDLSLFGSLISETGIFSNTVAANNFRLGTSATPGQVLTADASGNGTWQTISATTTVSGNGTNYWNLSGNNLAASSNDYNIGIGTTNPTDKLTIVGNINLMRQPGNDIPAGPGPAITFQSPSTEVSSIFGPAWISCGGGGSQPSCGTDNTPDKNADIAYTCAASDTGITYSNDISLLGGTSQRYKNSVTCAAGTSSYSLRTNNGTLEFLKSNGNTVNMSINQSGNVGIGTSPISSNKLTVAGDITGTGMYATVMGTNNFRLGTSATPGQVLTADASGNGTWKNLPISSGGGVSLNNIIENVENFAVTVNSNTENLFRLNNSTSTAEFKIGGGDKALVINNDSGDIKLSAGSKESLVVKNNGNVGIGTANPDVNSKLDVSGDSIFRGIGLFEKGLVINSGSSPTENGLIVANGNFGIGVSGPKNKLDVKGNVAIGSFAGVNTAPDNTLIVDNVGIGTANPNTALHIIGNVKIQSIGNVRNALYLGGDSDSTSGLIGSQTSKPSDSEDTCDGNATTNSCYDYTKNLCMDTAKGGAGIDYVEWHYSEDIDINVLGNQNGYIKYSIHCVSPDEDVYKLENIGGNLTFSNKGGDSRFSINQLGNVGIGGDIDSAYMLRVYGDVKANQFSTGDLLFNHDGKVVWRMYEDENGLYVQSPLTGKRYKMMMEEIE